MAFIPSNLSLIVQPKGDEGMRIFSYQTNDSVTVVTAVDYFVRGAKWGMRETDLIIVSRLSGSDEPYILTVDTIDAAGNGTASISDGLDGGAISPRLFGAKPDGVKVAATIYMSANDTVLFADGAAFTASDVGKSITIPKAGAAAGTLNTTITQYVSPQRIHVADRSGAAVSGVASYVYYGTDNSEAFQSALTLLSGRGGGTLVVPAGKYWFAKGSASLDPGMGNITILGEGRDATVLMWEGGDTTDDYSGVDSKSLFRNLEVTTKGYVRFEKLTIQGTGADPSFANSGGVAFWLDHYDSVEMIDAGLKETKATGMSVRYSGRFVSRGSHYTDIASGAIYTTDTYDALVEGNKVLRDGDDSFTFTTTNSGLTYGRPREGIIIRDNIVTCCVGWMTRIMGMRQVKVHNNIARFSGGGAFVGYVATQGKTIVHDVSICDNTFENLVFFSPPSSMINSAIGIMFSGDAPRGVTSTNGTIPGFYDITAGAWIYPWDYTDVNTNTATNPVAPITGVVVRGNKIRRTAPAVAAFSDYGYGAIGRNGVAYDGAVTSANLRQNTGIYFASGGLRDAVVSENLVEHLSFGILFGAPGSDRDYTNVLCKDNLIADCIVQGIGITAGAHTVDINIEGGIVDCDPYRAGNSSNADGSYSSSASTRGIAVFDNPGVTVSKVHFKNCGIPVYATVAGTRLHENVVWCNPVGTGFSASNKGIGDVPLGGNYRHVIYQCDPTIADYRQLVTNPEESAAAIPSAGTYVRGHFVRSEIPTIDGNNMTIQGWTRITTGTGHTSGTDWVVARTSHVSPAT